ncbi:DUF930 domain-containing protein [Rhizobium oryzicola]|uniref:DUF930 domain-containing protein n=1 Tax=Rhizobium oryzicola TaxID=1232668 RepID=A0ABT8SST6_9HYPH|nr:DUF930 domain-containing protein [Rhizobium oryzicola]MDO1581477.1 DUF930 domain-containing protein [Rhizobium oryzicola]
MAAPIAAHAIDSKVARQLDALTPEERREQRCDIEAMSRISKEEKGFRPDKVIAYTFSDPIEQGNLIKAPGAVFRSGGDWYRLKYKCETAEDGLKVMSFDYKVGAKVPREKWQEYYLYD